MEYILLVASKNNKGIVLELKVGGAAKVIFRFELRCLKQIVKPHVQIYIDSNKILMEFSILIICC